MEDPQSSGRINVLVSAGTLAHNIMDDAHGENYVLQVIPAGGTVISFDRAWSEVASGPVKAGSAIRLVYDVNRLLDFTAEI